MAPEHCPLVSGDHPSGGSHPRRGVPGREGQDPEGPVAQLCVFGTQGPRRHCRSGREDGAAPVGQASSPAPWPLRLLLPPFLARGAGHQGPQQGPEGRGSGQHTQGPGRREPRWREAGGRREGPTASRTRTRVCRGRWGCCRTVASRGRGASGPGTSHAVLHAACSLRCLDSGPCGPVLVCADHQQNKAWGSGLGGTPRCSLLSRPEQPLPCVEKLHPATFFCSDGDPVTALVPSRPF